MRKELRRYMYSAKNTSKSSEDVYHVAVPFPNEDEGK
jgi:hypothetical protein